MHNGLPSNHIYQILVDRHGYLWLSTPKGVIRYNGYEMKHYNLSNGLASNDIWELYEDLKGRIWFCSISEGIGYVKDNKYKSVYSKENRKIYPRFFYPKDSGVAFLSPYNAYEGMRLCVEENDTLHEFDINKDFPTTLFINTPDGLMSLDKESLSSYVINNEGMHRRLTVKVSDPAYKRKIASYNILQCNKNILFYNSGNDSTFFLNTVSGQFGLLPKANFMDSNGQVYHYYMRKDPDFKNALYLVAARNIYRVDEQFRATATSDIQSLIQDSTVDGSTISCMYENNLWGNCIGTTNKGVYINFIPQHFNKVSNFSHEGFRYAGTARGRAFWWQPDAHDLSSITTDNLLENISLKNIKEVNRVIPYSGDSMLIIADNHVYWYSSHTATLAPFFNNAVNNSFCTASDAIFQNGHDFYAIHKLDGFNYYTLKNNTYYRYHFDNDRYIGLTEDKIDSAVIAYTKTKIYVYKPGKMRFIIPSATLKLLGIQEIESIYIDNQYGNVIIKDYQSLYVYNLINHTFRQLLQNCNLKGATLAVYDNIISLAGNYGVLFCQIYGPSVISEPIIYQNVKNTFYYTVNDMHIADGSLKMLTDKGLYKIDFPSHQMFNSQNIKKNRLPYRLTCFYNDHIHDLKGQDTIALDLGQSQLFFDAINPMGNGQLVFKWRINNVDSTWRELSGGEIDIPELTPDKYYAVSMVAYDNTWQSEPFHIILYTTPEWWQQSDVSKLLWLAAIVFIVLLGLLIAYISKQIAIKNSQSRNARLELELKAVYSQMSPHFIFNTLSSALYFIRKKRTDEAYVHISKFSRLLRSYIKSSRNRFISIADEIENLKNYIELQQVRFENKFEYIIVVDPSIDANRMELPSLLLQPIVENAIDHGLFHKETKGHLTIVFTMEDAYELTCTIEDDGIGRKMSKLIHDTSVVKTESYGNQLLKDLVDVFNKYEPINIQVTYVDKEEPGTGTTVILKIKNTRYGR